MLFEINAVSPRNFSIRKQWLQNVLDEAVDKQNSTLSDMNLNSRATALMLEAMRVFCAGNWISTLIVSQATIDLHCGTKMDYTESIQINSEPMQNTYGLEIGVIRFCIPFQGQAGHTARFYFRK